jgi:transcriptional/translational regulatory protein YebC/TACO1
MFQQWGVVTLKISELDKLAPNREEAELSLIELGAEDIQNADDETVDIKTKIENFQKILTGIREKGIEIKNSGIQWIPKDPLAVNEAVAGKLEKLFGDLEENDDVEDYYTNAV